MAAESRHLRLSLKLQLLATLGLAAVVMVAYLQIYFGPATGEIFLDSSGRLIESSSAALRDASRADRLQSADLMKELIAHTTDSRQQHLQDLPLSVYEGDLSGMRQAILDMDEQRAARLQQNVEVLSREIQERSARRSDGFVALLETQQSELSQGFAAELAERMVTISGALLLFLLLLLGMGLHLVVVRPISQLRSMTRRIHEGPAALDAGLLPVTQPATRLLGSEVQQLQEDFVAMLERLRQTQAEVAEKNRQLEAYNQRLSAEVDQQSRQLVHAAKMASLGTLSGGIAHEFNNLIGGIRGCAREALAEAEGEAREPLEVILRATDRAQGVTEKLLHFARQRVDEKRVVCLAALLRETLSLVEPQLRQQKIQVEEQLDAGLEALVDPGALHQVFLNLLTNAIQAMPAGGRLQLRGTRRGRDGQDTEVEIRVTDSGVGMDATHLDRIFEPFFSTKDQSAGPNQGGTGLGLSVSFGIVEAHHGSLRAESQPGVGSTLILRLPIAPDHD